MSVDSPEPRQRTVAELLAENGGQQSGRRRRRRETGDDAGPVADGAPRADVRSAPPLRRPEPAGPPVNGHGAPPAFADEYPPDARNGAGGPAPGRQDAYGRQGGHGEQGGYAQQGGYGEQGSYPQQGGYGEQGGYAQQGGYGPSRGDGRPSGYAPPNGDGRQDDYGPPDGYGPNGYAPGPTGPAPSPGGWAPPAPPGPGPDRAPRGVPAGPGAEPEPPTGAFGARAPGANGSAPGFGAPPRDLDGGPPTQLGAPPLDDDDIDDRAWTGEYADDGEPVIATAPHRERAAPPTDGGPPTQAGLAPDEYDDYDEYDEYEDHGELEAGVEDDREEHRPRRGRRAAVAGLEDDAEASEIGGDVRGDDGKAAGTGQAWAMVIAQWIGGAIVGAGVWVGFRYLWTYFEIVALALSVVATVGLVLGVRALLRNDDLRTTMFAVLVGLLLTVSPALLVLLDR